MDVLYNPEKAADYNVFRIDYPDIVARLKGEPGEKYFSLNRIFTRWDEFAPQIVAASAAADDLLGRTIEMFVSEVERASAEGWAVFDRLAREFGS